MTQDTPEPVRRMVEKFEWKVTEIKNSLAKTYKSADDWSANYLNDHMEALKTFDSLPDLLTTLLAEREAEVRREEIENREPAIELLQEALRGEGAYSRDPLEHAGNTIENMLGLIQKAIDTLTPPTNY